MEMFSRRIILSLITLVITLVIRMDRSLADEGMWTLNSFPSRQVSKKYNFNATPDWLEHVRLSSARLAGGCSGSFT
ncbi:MAG: hypothetical protein C5B49_09825, partial [Bdellovibrio sp.]